MSALPHHHVAVRGHLTERPTIPWRPQVSKSSEGEFAGARAYCQNFAFRWHMEDEENIGLWEPATATRNVT